MKLVIDITDEEKCKICWHSHRNELGKYVCPFENCKKDEAYERLTEIKERRINK